MSAYMRRGGGGVAAPIKGRMAALAALVAIALLLTGCGGSSGPGVASAGNGTGKGAGGETAGASSPGGGGGPSTGSSSSGGVVAVSGGGEKRMIEFAKCMRSHGEPGFPEPVEGHIQIHGGPGSGLNPGSAQFRKASEACRQYMPHATPSPEQAAQLQEAALRFSQCMRSHGVPGFPDPKLSGHSAQLTIHKGSGVNPQSPQFQAAQKACQSLMPKGRP